MTTHYQINKEKRVNDFHHQRIVCIYFLSGVDLTDYEKKKEKGFSSHFTIHVNSTTKVN